ncbi:MAG: hypothetical protein IBJ19_00815 [Gemmatimonadaceae bacterium]|nr:hypothetical protein [Gemmatimonadaceae bacterium]
MNTAILHGEYVVLPTTLVPSMLADAASMVADSATLTVQSYQQAMLMLVRWYEAGQLAGRGAPATPPGGGAPSPVAIAPDHAAVVPSTLLVTKAPEAPTTSTAPAVALATASNASAPAPSSAKTVEPEAPLCETAKAEAETAKSMEQPVTEAPATSPRRRIARPFLPASSPPPEATPPCDALGHAARQAISHRIGPDVTDPGAQAP